MALRIRTVMTYPLDGSTEFIIPFEYLARKFVTVTLVGQDRKELVLNQDFRFVEKTKIQTSRTWTANDGYSLIEIRRYTSATERLVDFADGSILRAYDLNISQVQTLHVAEEARDLTADTIGVNNDGHLDARGRRIVNVADAVDEYDAVNLHTIKLWNDGAYQSYIKAQQEATRSTQQADRSTGEADRAKREADRAAASQSAATSSEANSKRSENNAKNSENASAGSASAARTSETNAKTSETDAKAHADRSNTEANRSKAEADRAKKEADKLGNMNELSGTIEKVEGDNVRWKGSHWWRGGVNATNLYIQNPEDTVAMSLNFNGDMLVFNRKGFTNMNWNQTQHYNFATRGYTAVRDGNLDVLGGNTAMSLVPSTGGDPADGNWVARMVGRWYSSTMDFGMVRGGGTDTNRIQLTLANPGQTNRDWNFHSDGVLRAPGAIVTAGNGTLHVDGNIQGTLWGGYLSNWLNNELNARTNEINNRVHDMRRGNTQEHASHGARDWESPWGYITGYRNGTGDGNIKFTTWICRLPQMYKNSTGWVDIGNW
ncbi:putative tail fiber protein [Erwinia phage pEa_SNUABM_57]|uniref:Tail fiber protein n=1 Tax=Erwinia phage pEa_SNUABM_57 TaxID=2996118 RepID=A0A9E8YYV9_9CAUD|nr:putative tail fiber protein [Erwinia phage pEa_SNUABM_57]